MFIDNLNEIEDLIYGNQLVRSASGGSLISIMDMFEDGALFEKKLVKQYFLTLDRSVELR